MRWPRDWNLFSDRRVFGAAAVLWLTVLPAPAAAHGVGGRIDLPVPLGYFLAGAIAVLVLTFLALLTLWPRPRLQEPLPLRQSRLPGWRFVAAAFRVFGVLAVAVVVLAGVFGPDNSVRNPAPVLVWVVLWLVVPFAGAVVGDLYRLLNPWRSLARWADLGHGAGPAYWPRWGVWPAVGLFFGFVWLELISPDSADPRALALVVLALGGLLLAAAHRFGIEAGLEAFDPFGLYNRALSALSPIDLDPAHGPSWRGWLRGLPSLAMPPGATAFVVILIGSVTFDGLSATTWYDISFGSFGASPLGATLLLIITVGFVSLAYWLACSAAARLAASGATGIEVARRFAHTLVPVALAYAFAHYFTLIVFEGQLLLSSLSDPFGRGWNLLGWADRPVDFSVLSPYAIWWIQVTAIVGGHIGGVLLAHDRALHDFPGVGAGRSQYAMLALMVALTGLGLVILAAS